jgi:hypothetical protein
VQEALIPAPGIWFHKLPIIIGKRRFFENEKEGMSSGRDGMSSGGDSVTIFKDSLFSLRTVFPGQVSLKNNGIMATGSLDRVTMVSVRRKNGYDIFNPFPVISMFQPVNMGKDVGIMSMGVFTSGSVGMVDLVMFFFKRVRQVGNLLFPDRFKDLVMGPELIEPDYLPPHLTGLVMVDDHAVAEKFLADGWAGRVDCAAEPRTIWIPE